jgi:tetratricopeptide (TPR) repeat protein
MEEAEVELNAVLRRDRENGRAYFHLGQLALMEQDYQGCLDNLQLAQQAGVPRQQCVLLASEAYRRQGNLQQADAWRAQANNPSDPAWPDPYFQQVMMLRTGLKTQLVEADLLFGRGKVVESVQLMQRASKEYPKSEWARIYLARGLIRLRRLTEAETALREALRLAPECAEVYFRMAVIFGLRGDQRAAVDWYRQAIERKPDMAMAYNNMGNCFLQLNDSAAAEAAFRRSVEVQPDFFEGHAALGTLYLQLGQKETAKSEFTAALKLRPGDPYVTQRMEQLED